MNTETRQPARKRRRAREIRWAICLAIAGLVGCGATEKIKNRKPVFPVAGQFSFGGAPADGAMISFFPISAVGPGRALPSQARAGADGEFQLTTYATADGAPEGEYVVTIYWPGARPAGADHDDEAELPPDRLHGRFATPGSSKLRARVPAKPTTFAPFDLQTGVGTQADEFYLQAQ